MHGQFHKEVNRAKHRFVLLVILLNIVNGRKRSIYAIKRDSQPSTVIYNIGTQNRIMLGILHLHMHGNSVGEGTAV